MAATCASFSSQAKLGMAGPGRRAVSGHTPGAAQHDADDRYRVRRLHRRAAREPREHAADATAGRRVAGRAEVGIDRRACLHRRTVRVGGSRVFRAAPSLILQVDRHRAEVGLGRVLARQGDFFRHRAGRGAEAVMAGAEEGDDVIHRPGAEAAPLVVGDVGGEPTLQRIALQGAAVLVAAKEVLRRVAHAAMLEPLDQIGASVPLRRLCRVRLKTSLREKQPVPDAHGRPDVERERQLVFGHRVMHCRHGCEIGADRQRILPRDMRRVGVRHGWIQMLAVAAAPLLQRIDEILVAPIPDAGRAIGRDIGGEDVAERRFDRPSACEGGTAGAGVTGLAIAHDGEVASALDQVEVLPVGLRTRVLRHRQAKQQRHGEPRGNHACTSGPGLFK